MSFCLYTAQDHENRVPIWVRVFFLAIHKRKDIGANLPPPPPPACLGLSQQYVLIGQEWRCKMAGRVHYQVNFSRTITSLYHSAFTLTFRFLGSYQSNILGLILMSTKGWDLDKCIKEAIAFYGAFTIPKMQLIL